MKIYVDTINSRIETDNPKLLKALYELYSFKIPGSEYSTMYKRRGWDGKTHFITKEGSFKTGLLPRLLEDLKKIECVPELEYRPVDQIKEPLDFDIEGFTYYDYQEDLIKKALSEKRGIVKSPTGSGKTIIMAGLVQALRGRKMVIFFNAKQILTQSYDFLHKDCGMDNIGICFGEGYIYGDIMLCTVQSVGKILDTHLEDSEVIMVDECHEFAEGKTTLAALRSFPKAQYRIGFTATPPSDPIPRYNLEGALGATLQTVDTASLIDKGKLTKPVIQMIKRSYKAEGKDEDMSFLDVYDEYIVNNEERNAIIKSVVDDIRSKNESSRILILTKSLKHGQVLKDLIGTNCQFLQGDNSISERYTSINKFRSDGKHSVLIGTKILQTGVNISEVTHFINARGMKSEVATIQALGRALRLHETKEKVYVYDFLDQEKYLKAHSKSRKKHYENEGHTVNLL